MSSQTTRSLALEQRWQWRWFGQGGGHTSREREHERTCTTKREREREWGRYGRIKCVSTVAGQTQLKGHPPKIRPAILVTRVINEDILLFVVNHPHHPS